MNENKISSNEINQILKNFNFLFNLKYKNEINLENHNRTTSFSSIYNNSNNYNEIEYIQSNKKKYQIYKNSNLFYLPPSFVPKNERIQNFYTTFLILKQNIQNKNFIIQNKIDFCNNLIKVVKNCNTQSKEFFLFLKNLWILTKKKFFLKKNLNIENKLLNKFDLFLDNIGTKTLDKEEYELHQAVFENNLRLITKLLQPYNNLFNIYSDVNECDINNNTPLLLAIKKNLIDAVQVLCDNNADINLISFENALSPLEYALKIKNYKILKILVNSKKKQKYFEWAKNKEIFFNLIKTIPNFSMTLKLNFDSNLLNIFSSINNNVDTYKISKLNGNMKIDMNLKNKKNENFSILINEDEKKIFKMDHINKISYDYIEHLLSDKDENKKVDKLLKEGIVRNKWFLSGFEFTNEKKNILNYDCQLVKINGTAYVQKEIVKNVDLNNSNNSNNSNFSNFDDNNVFYINFEDYFNYGLNKFNNFVFLDLKSQKFKKLNTISISNKNSSSNINNNNNKENNNNNNIIYLNNNNININIKQNIINTDFNDSNVSIESIKNKNIKIKKKQLNITCWISNDFPLKMTEFLPLIHILSFSSKKFAELESTISQKFLPFNGFPLKIAFPIGLNFHALLTLINFSLENPSNEEFNVLYINNNNNKYNIYNLNDSNSSNYNYVICDEVLKGNNNIINININKNFFLNSPIFTNFYDENKEKNIKLNSDPNSCENSDYDMVIREFKHRKKNKNNNFFSKSLNSNNNSENNISIIQKKNKNNNNNNNNKILLKDIKNDEKNLTPFIPKTPKKRNKKNYLPDLERQNTIKCLMKLKISPLAFIDKKNYKLLYNLNNKNNKDSFKNNSNNNSVGIINKSFKNSNNSLNLTNVDNNKNNNFSENINLQKENKFYFNSDKIKKNNIINNNNINNSYSIDSKNSNLNDSKCNIF